MNIIFKKFSQIIIFSILLLVVGGFFGGLRASASVMRFSMQKSFVTGAHCAISDEIQKDAPMDNTLMPCCIERHDNSGTILPASTDERVKFSQVLMDRQVDCTTKVIEQKIYPSSPSPPPEADAISSTIKLE